MQFEEDKAPIDKDEDADFNASAIADDDIDLDDDIGLDDEVPLLDDEDEDEVDHTLALRDDI